MPDLNPQIPTDPEPNQIVEANEGSVLGASYVLYVYRKRKLLGTAEQLQKIANVSTKSYLARARLHTPISKGDLLVIQFCCHTIQSIIFKEGFGWVGHTYHPDVAITEVHLVKVIDFLTVIGRNQTYFYEQIRLEKIKEKEDDTTTARESTLTGANKPNIQK